MGSGEQWDRKIWTSHKGRAHAGEPACGRPRGLRRAAALRSEISKLCSDRFHFGEDGQGDGEDFSSAGTGCDGEAQAYFYFRDEPFYRERGFRAGFGADAVAGKDSLYDAGVGGAADVCAVHQSRGEAALFLPAISGKPD